MSVSVSGRAGVRACGRAGVRACGRAGVHVLLPHLRAAACGMLDEAVRDEVVLWCGGTARCGAARNGARGTRHAALDRRV